MATALAPRTGDSGKSVKSTDIYLIYDCEEVKTVPALKWPGVKWHFRITLLLLLDTGTEYVSYK